MSKIHVTAKRDFINSLITSEPLPALAELVWNGFDAQADNVQIIFDLGLELSLPIETKKMLNNTVFKVVFKDASIKDDKDRINVAERFKRLSPETKVMVI